MGENTNMHRKFKHPVAVGVKEDTIYKSDDDKYLSNHKPDLIFDRSSI